MTPEKKGFRDNVSLEELETVAAGRTEFYAHVMEMLCDADEYAKEVRLPISGVIRGFGGA